MEIYMTIHELYDYSIENYGKRKYWISDIATALNISCEDANYLTYFLGYRRGKAGLIKTKFQFISDAGVKAIYAKIGSRNLEPADQDPPVG